jgi:hypothetical protein
MSIPNLIYKIKREMGIDKSTLIYLCIIIGVGIGSFGLGRISTSDNLLRSNNLKIVEREPLLENKNNNINEVSQIQTQAMGERVYVASKNGKMYYNIGCSGASRIKDENKVWFSTKEEAEKSGYALSSTCK